MAHLIGIDLGTSSVKVLLITENGRRISSGSAEYSIDQPRTNWAEQDPDAWWQATVTAVHRALAESGEPPSIAAIGLCGQMHGTVLLDADGHPLAPAIIWPDQRSRRAVEEITDLVGARRLIEIAGSPLATGFQAATIRWVQREQPSLWQQVANVVLPKDYLRGRLTGDFFTDPSDGSGTLLLDVHERDWSPELLEALGLDAAVLPTVQSSTAIAGELLSSAAEALNLPAGIPVIVGAGDTPASTLGAGAVTSDTLMITIGTGGQIVLPVTEVRVDTAGRIHTFCGPLSPASGYAGWYQMGATLSAGLALRWLRDQIMSVGEEAGYERMTSLAELTDVGAGGLIFLPYLVGERTPHMDPEARGLLLGLTLQHDRSHLVRAVMEGVAFSLYDAYTVLRDVAESPDRIVIAGGGARSRLWQQILADVFGLPVRRLEVTEQSAMGTAILAGAGIGRFDAGETAQRWATYGDPILPDRDHQQQYRELFGLFRDAYRKHRDDFPTLANWNT